LEIRWTVDGRAAGTDSDFFLNASDWGLGRHIIRVVVSDPTSMVRNDPAGLLSATRSWQVDIAANACASDITDQLSVQRSAFQWNRATGRYVQRLTLTNIGSADIRGPLSLVVDLPSTTARLFNQAGATVCSSPTTSGYALVSTGSDSLLSAGESTSVTLEFADPADQAITYTVRVLSGEGER